MESTCRSCEGEPARWDRDRSGGRAAGDASNDPLLLFRVPRGHVFRGHCGVHLSLRGFLLLYSREDDVVVDRGGFGLLLWALRGGFRSLFSGYGLDRRGNLLAV